MLFLLSLCIVLLTVYQLNRFFDYKTVFDWVLGAAMLLMACVVFTFTLLGLFSLMNVIWVVLLVQFALLGVSSLFTWKFKSHLHSMPAWDRAAFSLREIPVVALILAGVVILTLGLNLVYVLWLPPSNNDAQLIHLTRVAMWHQWGSWLPWDTPAIWQVTFPFNGQMLAYWSLLFLKREALLAFSPLLFGIFSAGIIYQLGVKFFHHKGFSLLSALVWLTLPVVQLNLTSSRHDHISTFLLLSALYFFLQQTVNQKKTNLVLVGLALALAVGTNMSVAAYLPGFALLFLMAWLWRKKVQWKDVRLILLAGLISFLLFSSPIFISNWIHFGSPLGENALSMTSEESLAEGSALSHLLLMNSRWGYQMLDCNGLPTPLNGYCFKVVSRTAAWLGSWTGIDLEANRSLLVPHEFRYRVFIPLSEDSAWFGPLGAVLSWGIGFYSLVAVIRRKDIFFLGAALFLLSTAIMLPLLRVGWTPYDGRYFMFLLAILSVGLVDILARLKPALQKIVTVAFSLLAGTILVMTILTNPAKTVFGESAFYHRTRLDLLSAQATLVKSKLYLVDLTVPEDGVLGAMDAGLYEYGLFGPRFTRTVIPIHPPERLCEPDWVDAMGIEYLLLDTSRETLPDCSQESFQLVDEAGRWVVMERK